ncbi:MAG: hypothetical protein ACJA0H_000428 [Francisellaceae bacterium]|jgi:hypothetical protein
MSTLNKKLIILAFSTIVLSACGGGGASDESKVTIPAPVDPTLSLSLEQTTLTVNENEQGIISLGTSYTGQSTIDYTVSFSPEISGVTAEIVDKKLQINVDELENEHVVTLTVSASSTADNLLAEQSVDVLLNNASVVMIINEVELWTDVDAVFKFDDFELLLPVYAKTAYLNGAMTKSEYQIKTLEFETLKVEAVNKKLSEENTLLSEGIADYREKLITETELVTLLSEVKNLASNQYNSLAEKINELAQLTNDTLPLLSITSFDYIDEYVVFSGIIGAQSMGVFTAGEWKFSEQYQFIETLIPALGKTNECAAN